MFQSMASKYGAYFKEKKSHRKQKTQTCIKYSSEFLKRVPFSP